MFSRLFEYTVTNTTSLFKKISVIGSVITAYTGRSSDDAIGMETRPLVKLRQENPRCHGMPYQSLPSSHHEIIQPHVNMTAEASTQHIHFNACNMITPADLASFLRQILKFQNDPSRFQDFIQANKDLLQALSVTQHQAIEHIKLTIPDYLTRHDASLLLKQYKKYVQQHEAVMKEHYHNTTADIRRADPAMQTFDAGFRAFIFSIIFNTLRDSLLISGLPPKRIDFVLNAFSYLVMMYVTDDYKILLKLLLLEKIIDALPLYGYQKYVKSAFAVGMAAAGTSNSQGLIKLGQTMFATLFAAHAAKLTRRVTSFFYPQINRIDVPDRQHVIAVINF